MALTSYDEEDKRPIIGFDMGGTSTDVSRYDGQYEHVFETVLDGITIQSPQLDVNTVASGGSSRLFFRNGLFAVGPESAASHPGPTCYRKGGPLAITMPISSPVVWPSRCSPRSLAQKKTKVWIKKAAKRRSKSLPNRSTPLRAAIRSSA